MNQIREIFLRRAAESSSRPRLDQWAFTQPVHQSQNQDAEFAGWSEVKGQSLLFEQLSVGDGGGNVRPLCCCSSQPLTRPPGPLTSDLCSLRTLLLMETHGNTRTYVDTQILYSRVRNCCSSSTRTSSAILCLIKTTFLLFFCLLKRKCRLWETVRCCSIKRGRCPVFTSSVKPQVLNNMMSSWCNRLRLQVPHFTSTSTSSFIHKPPQNQ